MPSTEEKDLCGRKSRAEMGRRDSAEKSEKKPEKGVKRRENSEVRPKPDKTDTKKSVKTMSSSEKRSKELKQEKPVVKAEIGRRGPAEKSEKKSEKKADRRNNSEMRPKMDIKKSANTKPSSEKSSKELKQDRSVDKAEKGMKGSAEKIEKKPENMMKRMEGNNEVRPKTDTKKGAKTKPSSEKQSKEMKNDSPADKNNNYCNVDETMKERARKKAGAKIEQKKGARNGVKVNGSRRDDGVGKMTDTAEKITERPRLPKGAKAAVPCSWRTSDVERNIKELEAKIQDQKSYIKEQENHIKGQEETRSHLDADRDILKAKTGPRAGVKVNGSKRDDEAGKVTDRGTTIEKKTVKPRLPKGPKAAVPCSWRTSDVERNIKDLEAKIQNQKNYIKGQEETLSSIDALIQTVGGMKEDKTKVSKQNREKADMLKDETGGYEQEVRYYASLIKTSDDTKNMSKDIYAEHAKHRKSLKNTVSIIDDKADRLHDRQDVAGMKDAIKSLHEARDEEDYLVDKLAWYQDKIKECIKPRIENDTEYEEENIDLPSDEEDEAQNDAKENCHEANDDFRENSPVKLPFIGQQNANMTQSSDKATMTSPLSLVTEQNEETLQRTKTRRGRLPDINGHPSTNVLIIKHRSDPCLDLESLLESHKDHREDTAVAQNDNSYSPQPRKYLKYEVSPRRRVRVPSCVPPLDLSFLDEEEDDDDDYDYDDSIPTRILPNIKKRLQEPPKTPQTPWLIRRIRALIGWK